MFGVAAKIWKWGIIIAGVVMAVKVGINDLRLWKSGERIRDVQVELEKARLENGELQKKLVEVQSPEFIEKEAREKLGYGREGEVILILPNQNNAQGSMHDTQEDEENWRKWWGLYISD